MAPLGVVTDFVVILHPDPLRDGTILFHLFCQFDLDTEGLKSRHFVSGNNIMFQRVDLGALYFMV